MSVRPFTLLVRMSLRGRRLVGTVLFVGVVALASAAFVVGLLTSRDASRVWDAAFDRAAGPHVTLSGADESAFGPLVADDRVVAASQPVAAREGVELRLADEAVDMVLRASDPASPPAVGAPYVTAGRAAASASEVVLEQSLADDAGIEVGDVVALQGGTTSAEMTVVGTVLDFNDCFYPQCDPGVAWVTPAGFDRFGADGRFLQVYLRLDDASAAPGFAVDAMRAEGDRLGGTQDWLDTRKDAVSINQYFGAFLAAFGVFTLIAAGVVIAGSVTNRVLARRRDIGLLKAVGVTPRQVVGTITLEHLVLGGLGVAAGWLLGSVLAPELRIGVTEVLEPGDVSLAIGPLVVTLAVMGLIVAVATVVPSRRTARLVTADALRPLASRGGRSRVAALAERTGAGPVVVSGAKDAFSRPLRTVLAALSLVLALVAVIVTLGVSGSVDEMVADPALGGDPWDVAVAPSDGADPQAVVDTVDATSGVSGWYSEWTGRQVVDGEVVLVQAIGGDPADAAFVIRDGRPMTAPGEAIAGYGLLDELRLGVGDTVSVEVEDAVVPVTIVGRYAETEDTGVVLAVRAETFADAGLELTPSVFRVSADDGVDRGDLAAALAERLGADASVQPLTTDTESVDAFRVAFGIVAGLVVVVALANLAATLLLAVRERARDLGVLRAIGFTPRQLVGSASVSALAVTFLALVVGVPLGILANDALLQFVGEAIGVGPELAGTPPVGGLLAVVVVLVVVTIGLAAMTSARTTRRPVSELVRYE